MFPEAWSDSYRMLYQRYQCSAVTLQPPGDFEFQQHGAHDRGRGARHSHQIVDRRRRQPEQRDDAAALVLGGLGIERPRRFLCGLLRRQFEASILAATARDRITSLFGQHVSPQVVERLMAEGAAAGSEIRRVAVMFVDFRSFTAGASTRSPREVVDRLDGAFAVLVDILDRHGGIVNKFLGDGFLALFGAPLEAPDAARRAVAAAREMLAANEHANQATS